MKRKREKNVSNYSDNFIETESDPYRIDQIACSYIAHHKAKTKSKSFTRNCAQNPNCLYGLGEHHKGIWSEKSYLTRAFGEDPQLLLRGEHTTSDETTMALPCGLRNLGATCYLNSMLQCLFMNVSFRRAVYEWEPMESTVKNDPLIMMQMKALQKLFAYMQFGAKFYYDPQEFASTLSLNQVLQQDAQEFSKLLLSHLRKIFTQGQQQQHLLSTRTRGTHWNPVDQIFQGEMSYVTKCLKCKTKSTRLSSYYELSLNIKGHASVRDCLASYFSPEILDGDNKYLCEACNSKQHAERYLQLDPKRLPPTFTLQLMRFVYDMTALKKKKISDILQINSTINMSEILRNCGHEGKELWEDESKDVKYRLFAYLNHRGKSAHVGHYTACVAYPHPKNTRKNNNKFEWFEFDDGLVKGCSTWNNAAEMTKEEDELIIRSKDAYMLLYLREDEFVDAMAHTDEETDENIPTPSQDLMEEVATDNVLLEDQVKEYKSKSEALKKRMEIRKQVYAEYFEKKKPVPSTDAQDFYWIDAEWLKCWITGEFRSKEQQQEEEEEEEKVQEPSNEMQETPVHNEETGDEEKKETEDQDAIKNQKEVKDSDPTYDPEKLPFSNPMNCSQFVCPHSLNSFSPENASQMKRISKKLFEFFKSSYGLEAPTIFHANSYRCNECIRLYTQKNMDQLVRVQTLEEDINTLKQPLDPEKDEAFYISRTWMNMYRTYLQKQLKEAIVLSNATINATSKFKQQRRQLNSSNDASSSEIELLTHPINADIACEHGQLILDKKKYRTISKETWDRLLNQFRTTKYEYKANDFLPNGNPGPNTNVCQLCLAKANKKEEDLEILKRIRHDVLGHTALNRLFRRKSGFPLTSSWSLSEFFTVDQPFFLISRKWVDTWKEYLDGLNTNGNGPPCGLSSSESFCCQHGKLLLPRTVTLYLTGASITESEVEVEFVTLEEMKLLDSFYGVGGLVEPSEAQYLDTYFYVVRSKLDQMTWKSCSNRQLSSLQQQNPNIQQQQQQQQQQESESSSDTFCRVCQDSLEKKHLEEMTNFSNKVVNVHLLADDQALPTEELYHGSSNAGGRRRSKRIKPGTATGVWPILANAEDTVYVLKTKVYEEIDIVPARQRLYYKGQVLNDAKSLKSYDIKAGESLFMRIEKEENEDCMLDDPSMEKEIGFEDSVLFGSTLRMNSNSSSTISTTAILVWVCEVCTFVNEIEDQVCEMCEAAKVIHID